MQPDYRLVEQAKIDLHHLLIAHPEIEEDEILHVDMVTAETNTMELLDQLIEAERDALIKSDAIDLELDRLRKRQARFDVRRGAIRKFMMQLMEAASLRRAERPGATVSIASGRQKVVITNETELPPDYIRTKREPNKEKIARDLKDGITIPGALLSNADDVLRVS